MDEAVRERVGPLELVPVSPLVLVPDRVPENVAGGVREGVMLSVPRLDSVGGTDGVPVAKDDAVPVTVDEAVPVRVKAAVSMTMEDAVPVAEDDAVPVTVDVVTLPVAVGELAVVAVPLVVAELLLVDMLDKALTVSVPVPVTKAANVTALLVPTKPVIPSREK